MSAYHPLPESEYLGIHVYYHRDVRLPCGLLVFYEWLGPQVDNVILRDPPMLRSPLFVGLDLTPLLQPQQQPCPGGYFQPLPLHMSRSAEALLRQQGPSPADQENPLDSTCVQQSKASQEFSALQQLAAILKQDVQWLQVWECNWQDCRTLPHKVRATKVSSALSRALYVLLV